MSAAAMTATADPTSASAKKPYARQMTEKRKEQNRRSQKVYRERLKKKLEELEEKVQEQTQTQTQPKQSSSPAEATVRIIPEHFSPSPVSSTASKNSSTIIDLNAAFAAAGDLVLPTDNTLPTFDLGIRDRAWQSASSTTLPSPRDSITADYASMPIFLAAEVYMPADPESADMRLMWPMPQYLLTESYTPPTAKERRVPRNASTFASSKPILSLGRSPFPRTNSSHNMPSGIPSPYLNHLRLLGESAFIATLAIAATLGITRSAFVNDHPSPLGPYGLRAPSYNYKTIPKDLRPTREQITLCHPGYLDCIVFPRFRSTAIVLSARGELNHAALFLDLMHDGLVCWGNESASAYTGRDMRDGVAWSKRSWEARPWFLRKWGWLLAIDPNVEGIGLASGHGVVVDEDEHDVDGMFEGSRWWRSMRGEVADIDETQPQRHEESVEEHGELLSRHVTCNIGIRDVNEFAGNGTLWPTQFQDPMAMKLDSMGLSAPRAMELDFGRRDASGQHLQGQQNAVGGFGFSLY